MSTHTKPCFPDTWMPWIKRVIFHIGGRGAGGRGAGGRGGGGRGGGKPGGFKGGKTVVIEPHRHEGIFIARGKEDALVTRNLVPGSEVYGEKRISVEVSKQTEYLMYCLEPEKNDDLCRGTEATKCGRKACVPIGMEKRPRRYCLPIESKLNKCTHWPSDKQSNISQNMNEFKRTNFLVEIFVFFLSPFR